MSWTINGTRIYVLDHDESVKQDIARLQPLASGTIHHVFGFEDPIIKVSCKIVGTTNMNAVKSLTNLGTTVPFSGDLGSRTVYVSNVGIKRSRNYWQTLDITQDCTAPVFDVELELYEDV
jgi:hypothetical protein